MGQQYVELPKRHSGGKGNGKGGCPKNQIEVGSKRVNLTFAIPVLISFVTTATLLPSQQITNRRYKHINYESNTSTSTNITYLLALTALDRLLDLRAKGINNIIH
ncbi:hypothetical protein RRG08_024408 [Elysia crispata]|uniref:Uncharacterized protein n=1 Tax=Elysia crispata TaxID=231223 RepID=A0AAE0YP34_9GAST|nr:hypothetical protein RRG08_024408 [Elysia crispata]